MTNVIAIIWDFDKTLIQGYMQAPIFEEYGIDARTFWSEVNALPQHYLETQNVRVNPDTIYLNTFINYVASGKFKGLNNAKLRSYGAKQIFYPGIPAFFEETTHLLDDNELCCEYNIKIEHYIVSTGFAEVVKGTTISRYVKGIWGCELIEHIDEQGTPFVAEIGYTIDNTTKTRAIFEINKGTGEDVNSMMTHDQRRIDFKNMIYIADGPSDIPAFSVVKGRGGATFAIYPPGDERAFRQVDQLRAEKRVDMFAEANYTQGTTTHLWICNKIKDIAARIIKEEESKKGLIGKPAKHLD